MNQILVYCMLDKSSELFRRQQLSVVQQFGTSEFYTVVHRHKQDEMDIECVLHISIILAISMPKIIKFGGDLMTL